jgi:hypothetical protein
MGLDANIMCIGRFDKEIVDCLPYGPEFYEGMILGMIVTTQLLNCNTSDQSRQLAAALGTEPWDFNTHCISKDNVDWDALDELSEICAEWDKIDVEKLRRLLDSNFICIYQPNG